MSDVTPEPGSESRPRPQYGEYATPEEQRARIAHPELVPTPVPASTASSPEHWSTPAPVWTTEPERPAARPRLADRIATFALLAYGLATVVTALPALIDYVGYAHTLLSALGVDADLADPAGARAWGVTAAIVLAAGWLATAALSLLRLRTGKLTWWIPLVGGIVFNFASAFFMLVPIMRDPAIWSALQAVLTGG